MAETVRGLHALQWTEVIDLRIRQLNGDSIHVTMTEVIDPPGGGKIQAIASGGFIVYWILDSDSVELERHMLADWFVVTATLVIP